MSWDSGQLGVLSQSKVGRQVAKVTGLNKSSGPLSISWGCHTDLHVEWDFKEGSFTFSNITYIMVFVDQSKVGLLVLKDP